MDLRQSTGGKKMTKEEYKKIQEELKEKANPEVERANFRMIYEQLAERSKRDSQISDKLKSLIDSTQTKMIGAK